MFVLHYVTQTLTVRPASGISSSGKQCIKGSHTICFIISFHDVNQMPMSSRTNFHCETTRFLKFFWLKFGR